MTAKQPSPPSKQKLILLTGTDLAFEKNTGALKNKKIQIMTGDQPFFKRKYRKYVYN